MGMAPNLTNFFAISLPTHFSGTNKISERAIISTVVLNIEETNKAGGVLGQRIVPAFANPRGLRNHADLARQLIGELHYSRRILAVSVVSNLASHLRLLLLLRLQLMACAS